MPRASIYFRPEEDPTYQRFKQIVRREGSNVSRHLMDYIKGYVDFHDPGNPQARMTSFVDGGSYDLAAVEGEIRQIFLTRGRKGVDINLREIVNCCKAHMDDGRKATAMAERTYAWLREQGVKAWR